MLRSCRLLPLLLLGVLTSISPLQAQSLSGGRISTAGGGSPAFGGPTGSGFSQGPQIVGGPPGASVGRTPPRNFTPMPLSVQPPGEAQNRVTSPSATPFEVFPRKNDKKDPEWLTGPATGISLDEAIGRLIHENLDLRARYSDISQADSDVLTANLRSNPIAYSDANGVPYGNYRRAAGPLQYDVNFVYPLDVSHKRQTRTRAATAARMVIEASYRDAVRLTIDLLYQAYVDALAAQVVIDVRAAKQHDAWAEIDVDEPQSALEQAQRSLALLINVPAAEIHDRKISGRLQFNPKEEEHLYDAEPLVRLALVNRPDLQAQRLAVSFAEANINAVLASRFDDVLLLYQPYTFHDGRQGIGNNNSLSWTVGVTVPLPIYNRQQGNLLKARQAADQARTRLALLEKTVASDVEAAVLEHKTSHEALTRTWTDFDKYYNPPNLTSKRFNAILGPRLELTSWGDGSKIPRTGHNLVIVGADNQGVLHIRIFDVGGNCVQDTDETAELRRRPAQDFATLKKLLANVSALKQPTRAQKAQFDSDIISVVMSIVGTPEQKLNDDLRVKLMDMENRVKDLLDDQISDKLKTYWDTLIRHRKAMLKLNTVTGACVSP